MILVRLPSFLGSSTATPLLGTAAKKQDSEVACLKGIKRRDSQAGQRERFETQERPVAHVLVEHDYLFLLAFPVHSFVSSVLRCFHRGGKKYRETPDEKMVLGTTFSSAIVSKIAKSSAP